MSPLAQKIASSFPQSSQHVMSNSDSKSPPSRSSPQQQPCRPKTNPTVTPRRFKRFFTPRISLERGRRYGVRRLALSDVTTSAANRKGRKNSSPLKNAVKSANHGTENMDLGFENLPDARKRKGLCGPMPTPDQSSPLKKRKRREWSSTTVAATEVATEDGNTDIEADGLSDEDYESVRRRILNLPKPIVRSKYRTSLGALSRRELSTPMDTSERSTTYPAIDWSSETADFFSRPEDVHMCNNIAEPPPDRSLPFCTASCNTNSLVAIGDEEGGIRILDSARDCEQGFRKTYLSFRPHANAVLDLSFSSDDSLLATASGDQTSRIVDMRTQRCTYTLAGHASSVKQVRFQPGSSDKVVATCSRDGCIQIWDLRCHGSTNQQKAINISLDGTATDIGTMNSDSVWAPSMKSITEAHANRNHRGSVIPAGLKPHRVADSPSKLEPTHPRRGDVSITSLSFLDESRAHLLITGSEANASVKLWDLRTTHNLRRGHATPVSTTCQPESHTRYRQYGLTSMALSGNASRLYTLSRDNTVYVHSVSHLIIGSAPELHVSSALPRGKRSSAPEKEGLGPLYGFRHHRLHVSTFYVKLAVRPARDNRSELLAVGSSDSCALVFPTDERYMPAHSYSQALEDLGPAGSLLPTFSSIPSTPTLPTPASTPCMPPHRMMDTIPMYAHGSPLVRGHSHEVTGVCWSSEGELISVGDDFRARVWRENAAEARTLRVNGERGGGRWGRGWAEVDGDWDDDDA